MAGGFTGGGDAGGPSRTTMKDAPEVEAYSHLLQKEGFKDEATKAWEDYAVENKAGREFGKDDEEEDQWAEEGDAAPTIVEQGSEVAASEWKKASARNKQESKAEAEATKSKDKGNDAYTKGRYDEALSHFNRAITLTPDNHILYSNRSACHSANQAYKAALEDARKAVSLKPDWAKGHSRIGAALIGLKQYVQAVAAYEKAARLEPGNKQVQDSLKQAKELLAAEEAALEKAGKVKFTKRKLDTDVLDPSKKEMRKHKPASGSSALLSFNDEEEDEG